MTQPTIEARLTERTAAILPGLIALRRDLHQHPELAFSEIRTSRLIAERLSALGLEVRTDLGCTGVVALLRGARPGRTVALRADIDALPVNEQNDLPYRSEVPGVMHACGHDGHAAVLVGVAETLAAVRDELEGNIKFIFQPAEEPVTGAKAM
ncbi:MAG TPA: amidohydrolase, partial [Armatimonadota bacterium]|nr:amidohydrolase [Armatimonadota bacterium]